MSRIIGMWSLVVREPFERAVAKVCPVCQSNVRRSGSIMGEESGEVRSYVLSDVSTEVVSEFTSYLVGVVVAKIGVSCIQVPDKEDIGLSAKRSHGVGGMVCGEEGNW